jgi:hypothetical protein
VEDTYWMEDKVKVEWEEAALDLESIFREMDKPAPRNTMSFLDSQIKEFMVQDEQYISDELYLTGDTGSRYLDPAWRQNIAKIYPKLTKIQVLISLN